MQNNFRHLRILRIAVYKLMKISAKEYIHYAPQAEGSVTILKKRRQDFFIISIKTKI